nr:MAG TPA: hypothetical protein [Caudoviricetes sp.]
MNSTLGFLHSSRKKRIGFCSRMMHFYRSSNWMLCSFSEESFFCVWFDNNIMRFLPLMHWESISDIVIYQCMIIIDRTSDILP